MHAKIINFILNVCTIYNLVHKKQPIGHMQFYNFINVACQKINYR